VRGDDQVGIGRDLPGDHEFRIGLHRDRDSGVAGRGREPVLGVSDDDASDFDAVLAQHVQCRHAEMAGADQGNPHGV
jgi:hypothetical protein